MVQQRYASFGVTTDSVLLGAWADISGARTILDIGTGTGLLALMVAQRSDALITAIEPDPGSYMQAGINFAASPWPERLVLMKLTLQQFLEVSGGRFDAIITNPPYFVDSLPNPDTGKAFARHMPRQGQSDLLDAAVRLLAEDGSLHLVLPAAESVRFADLALESGLHLRRRMMVMSLPGRPPARALLTLGRQAAACKESELVIESGGRHQYSEEYISLTREFYLKF